MRTSCAPRVRVRAAAAACTHMLRGGTAHAAQYRAEACLALAHAGPVIGQSNTVVGAVYTHLPALTRTHLPTPTRAPTHSHTHSPSPARTHTHTGLTWAMESETSGKLGDRHGAKRSSMAPLSGGEGRRSPGRAFAVEGRLPLSINNRMHSVRVCGCGCGCGRTRVYMWVRVHVGAHVHAHMSACVRACARACTQTCARTRARACACASTYVQQVLAFMCLRMHAWPGGGTTAKPCTRPRPWSAAVCRRRTTHPAAMGGAPSIAPGAAPGLPLPPSGGHPWESKAEGIM